MKIISSGLFPLWLTLSQTYAGDVTTISYNTASGQAAGQMAYWDPRDGEGLWDDLPQARRDYYTMIGHTKELWDAGDDAPFKLNEDLLHEGQAAEDEDDLYWHELPRERRDLFELVGWTEHMWNNGYENYLLLDWSEMEEEMRQALEVLGWSEALWKQSERTSGGDTVKSHVESIPWSRLTKEQRKAALSLGLEEVSWHENHRIGSSFEPIAVKFHIPELEALDFDYLSTIEHVEVELMDGATAGDDEYCAHHYGMTMGSFIKAMRKSNHTDAASKFYLKYEDHDTFKSMLREPIGFKVLEHLVHALKNSILAEKGYFKPEYYQNIEYDDSNWLIWAGGAGTFTSMHMDEDKFNFIWVVEGRKRVVLLPNDDRTAGKYECATFVDGHSCWTGVDILNGTLPEHAIEVEIGPGEGLMIPHLSWHAVQNLEHTLAYGFRII